MFKKIKEFFSKPTPTVETATQEVTLTVADVAIKNIKETTASVDAKVEVTEAAPQQAWTKNSPAPIAKTTRKKPQTTKAPATTAPKKRKPAPK
jgi:hypothetical protein